MIKVALVGCGRIFKRHATLLSTGQIQGATLSAVCDINESRAKAGSTEFDVPSYLSIKELMTKAEVDLVTVLTPSGSHAENVIELSQYGKPIIVEKPMALTLDDADRMMAACDQNKAPLFVVKQNRFNLPILKLREAIEDQRFGKLVLGTVRVRWCRKQDYYDQDEWRGTWAMDGGVLTNQASHHIDLLTWMMGDVESVFAKSNTALSNIEVEDTAVVTLKFKNGALGVIEATTATRPKDLEGSLSILGEKGVVEVGGFAVNELKTWNFQDESISDKETLENFSNNPPNVYGFGHKEYYDNVIQSLQNGASPLINGLEGRKSLELIMAIYESIETGKEVFLRFKPTKCKLGEKR